MVRAATPVIHAPALEELVMIIMFTIAIILATFVAATRLADALMWTQVGAPDAIPPHPLPGWSTLPSEMPRVAHPETRTAW